MALRPDTPSVFNVCTGQATSVAELAAVIGALARKNPDARNEPPRSGEIRHSLGDPSAMRLLVGPREMVALRDGLVTVLTHLGAQT
jgi:UDP-glucose 4-epimerase